jgi:hypothetical protein
MFPFLYLVDIRGGKTEESYLAGRDKAGTQQQKEGQAKGYYHTQSGLLIAYGTENVAYCLEIR